MKIIAVTDEKTNRLFLTMPLKLYRNDVNYIRPLDEDIIAVFDSRKNPAFEHGEAARWILIDEEGEPIGRIAAFYDRRTFDEDLPAGGCGFFECIDNQDAANLLFDTAKNWLSERGLEAMDGPVNFGSRERWWGLLVDGFHPPCYRCNYNRPYYKELYEQYGFQLYFKQFTFRRDVETKLSSRISEKAMYALKDAGYTFSHIDHRRLDKAAEDFRTVYNAAWVNRQGTSPLTKDEARKLIFSMKPIIDPKIVWFAYHNGEPVGFWVNIPDINQLIVKYVNGRLNLLGKLRFLWNKWRKNCDTMFGIIFGVVPEHQRKGVEAAMALAAAKVMQDPKQVKYNNLQMNWIGDFNPRMMNVARHMGGVIYKTHHTYRYLFDRSRPFERHPIDP